MRAIVVALMAGSVTVKLHVPLVQVTLGALPEAATTPTLLLVSW